MFLAPFLFRGLYVIGARFEIGLPSFDVTMLTPLSLHGSSGRLAVIVARVTVHACWLQVLQILVSLLEFGLGILLLTIEGRDLVSTLRLLLGLHPNFLCAASLLDLIGLHGILVRFLEIASMDF